MGPEDNIDNHGVDFNVFWIKVNISLESGYTNKSVIMSTNNECLPYFYLLLSNYALDMQVHNLLL